MYMIVGVFRLLSWDNLSDLQAVSDLQAEEEIQESE